jgi:hypothetical protein
MAQALDTTNAAIRANQTPFHERQRREAQLYFVMLIVGIILGVFIVGGVLGSCVLMLLFRK